ncbi:MAG TPA: zinc ribbon domain-containing protein [Gaiellaceae bacterium]|nr:zinc ribbon domain-containing protein [Gaiellaceae bacterium]
MSSVPRVCSACGAASAWDARFCHQCGRPLDERTPRYYGVLSPGPAFVLGCVLLVAAVVALIAGSVIAAIVLLAVALVAFVFFYEAARRDPDDRVARSVVSSGHRLRGWVSFAIASVAAWARASRDVLRLRRESRSLRREREPTLRLLGDAVYREDEPLVQTLLERIREIDGELEKREEARAETLAAARRHVDEERGAARATQRFVVEQASDETSDE